MQPQPYVLVRANLSSAGAACRTSRAITEVRSARQASPSERRISRDRRRVVARLSVAPAALPCRSYASYSGVCHRAALCGTGLSGAVFRGWFGFRNHLRAETSHQVPAKANTTPTARGA